MPVTAAQRAFAFTDSVGVNLHLNWQDAGLAWGNFTLIKNAMQYLGARQARDGVPYVGWTLPLFEQLADIGVKFTILMNRDDLNASGSYASSLDRVQALQTSRPNSVACIEGLNEINNWTINWAGSNTGANLSLGRPIQQALWDQVHARPAIANIPIANLTLGGIDYNTAQAQLGNMSAWADYGTWHTYFGNGDQPRQNITNGQNVASAISPGKQLMTTECGYYTAVNDMAWGGGGVDYAAQARLMLTMLAVHHQIGGKRAHIYELLDNNTDLNADQDIENSFGIFEGNGNPKPAATGIRNMLAALSDTATNAASFTTGSLDYTMTGLPATGRHFLLQKADGSFHVVVWAEPKVWNQPTRSRVVNGTTNVTLTLAAPATSLKVTDPLTGAAVTTLASQTVTVPVSDYPMIVSITGVGTGGGTGGEPTTPTNPAPEPVTIGIGADALVLRLTQDFYLANATYTVSVDGVQIGPTLTANALRGSGSVDVVTVKGNWPAGPHQVTINNLTDAYGGTATTDRNLYLEAATFNGIAVNVAGVNLLSAGPASFTVTKVAVPVTMLRPGSGRFMVTRGGAPMLSSAANVAAAAPPITALSEPAAPAGWGEVFFDSFRGLTLDRYKWQILFGGGPNVTGTLIWDHGGIIVSNGLTIRTWKDAAGAWRSGGIGQGNSVTAPFQSPLFAGYGDLQFSIRARLPKGKGVGAVFAAWPYTADQWPPEFDLLESPGADKASLLTTWHWVANPTGVSKAVALDLTQDHVYTARRTAGRWNYWIDGVEVAAPTEWAANPSTALLNVQISGFVAKATDAWYGGAPDTTTPNPYDVHVSWVRVVAPGGGALSVPPDENLPVPADPSNSLPDVQVARNFVAPLTIGMNIERGNAWQMAYQGQSLRTSTAYWLYLKSCGYTHVRMFMAWRPSVDMLGLGLTGAATPSDALIDTLLDSCESAIAAGLRVFCDWTDVIGIGELNTYWSGISAYLDRVAVRIAARSSLSLSMFAPGPFNELEGGDNPTFNAYRRSAHAIFRNRLPKHVLVTGAAYWSDPAQLYDGTWQAVQDQRVAAQWHLYPTDLSAASAAAQESAAQAFSARNGTIPVVGGEAGFNNGWRAGDQAYGSIWHTNMRLWATHCGQDRPMFWCVTNGSVWRANRSATDPTLLAEIETTGRACDQIIRGSLWWNPLPFPGT